MFLHLFHGRSAKDEELEDWGADGPTFGPLQYVHTTYAFDIKLGNGDYDGHMYVDDDMIRYDGKWYGDWSVSVEATGAITPFEQSKADSGGPFEAVGEPAAIQREAP